MNSTKNNQQRRSFFQTVKSQGQSTQQRGLTGSRPRGLAVILAVLLCSSCASLTPERLALILDLVGSAAQVGIQLWLQSHPGARPAVDLVLAELAALSARGTPPSEAEVAAVLNKLPPEALKGTAAEVYLSGDNIVVWDSRRFEAHSVDKKSAGDVARVARIGIRAGLAPVAPLPVRPAVRMVPASPQPTILYVTNQQVILIQPPDPVAPPPVVESPRPRSSVVDFKMATRVGIYVVEQRVGTNWSEVSSFTSRPGEFRVRLR